MRILFLMAVLAAVPAWAESETTCDDAKDNDGDGLTDCADADCYGLPICKPDGGPENTNRRCSDWIDNDNDGLTDCDDDECGRTPVCMGSWDLSAATSKTPVSKAVSSDPADEEIEGDPTNYIGTRGDLDGERSNEVCADGLDNDGDGKTDCEDFGCRYDPGVTVCQAGGGIKFSAVVGVGHDVNFQDDPITMNTKFDRIQLRALGSIPLIANSFFLLSFRAEIAPRLTFAMFQVPLGTGGMYLNLNSGSGGLSSALVTSTANQLLLDPANYVYRAMEQGNGAAVEVGGPVTASRSVLFRTFLAGGSGRFSGNVGGQFFNTDADRNYSFAIGGQLQFNILGSYSRFDSPFLFVPAPTTLGGSFGLKYEQRPDERFPASNAQVVFRSGRVVALGEVYSKRELDFGSWQSGQMLQLGFLAIPKMLMLAADAGTFIATEFETNPTDARKPLNELQWRVAAHYYFYRNIGLLSAMFRSRDQQARRKGDPTTEERVLSFQAQFRF